MQMCFLTDEHYYLFRIMVTIYVHCSPQINYRNGKSFLYQPNISPVCFTVTFVGFSLHPMIFLFHRYFLILPNISSTQYIFNTIFPPPNISSTQYFLHPIFPPPKIFPPPNISSTQYPRLIFLLRNHEVRQAEWLQAHQVMPTAKRAGGEGGG